MIRSLRARHRRMVIVLGIVALSMAVLGASVAVERASAKAGQEAPR